MDSHSNNDSNQHDPFEVDGFSKSTPSQPAAQGGSQPSLADEIIERQKPFVSLINQFEALFWDLPKLTTRDVDARIKPMYDELLKAASYHGISSMTAPRLVECCGKTRTWPDGQKTGEVLGWGLGDIVRRITRAMGIRHCEGCERRRLWLNAISWWKK